MNCVALCVPGKSRCIVHLYNPDVRLREYKRDHVKKHWPPTPWDDEKPWYEDNR